ncbi:hypothetical protein [Adhaeribacter aquaticus]|uniref:hypothetical protein n=1 Tax=Adhaeribacter aquaticus TaxID=299567 RepID=UPI0003F58E8F|nr:hypothetical protein [Adhaeribacter aquaticus]
MKLKYLPLFIFSLLVLRAHSGKAQDSQNSNTDRPWYLPDHVAIQFAGNIGLLAVGPGYSYLRDKVDTEFLYGITPGFETNTSIHIITAKTSYHPVLWEFKNGIMLEPLKIGTGISYSIGRQFHTTWPARYPDGYYWWTTSFRFTPYLGFSISKTVGNQQSGIKRIAFSPEIGTHDLALVSFLNNKHLGFGKILNLAFNARFIF